ncbi:MAG: hypothetical protein AAF429_05165 [Pseudomonadota bacterium]
MKRRTFLGSIAAALALPPLKIPLAAAPTAAAQDHFWVAKLVAETRGAISVEGLMTQLRLDRSMARDVQHLLFKEGIVAAPKAGLATALKPWNIPALAPEVAAPHAGTKLALKQKTPSKTIETIVERGKTPHTAEENPISETDADPKPVEYQPSLSDQSHLEDP